MKSRVKRIGLISVHTCPLAVLGGKETGGMNVYVREVARHLGRLGLDVDVFTRRQTPGVPTVVPLGPGARVVHIEAGPQRPVPPAEIVVDLDEFIDGVAAFQRRTDTESAPMQHEGGVEQKGAITSERGEQERGHVRDPSSRVGRS